MAKTALINKANKKPKFGVRAYTRCQRCGRIGHAGVGCLAQDLPAALRHQRVDGHDAVAMRLHVLGRKVAGAVPLRREAHHCHGAAGGEQVAQGADGVGGVEHANSVRMPSGSQQVRPATCT